MSVTCDRWVVFSWYCGFLHQYNWPPRYNWNIVESGVKHHRPKSNLYDLVTNITNEFRCHRGRYRMVLGFTVPVTTIVASTISACGEVNVMKFVSNLWQIVSFSPGIANFPPIKQTYDINEILLKWRLIPMIIIDK